MWGSPQLPYNLVSEEYNCQMHELMFQARVKGGILYAQRFWPTRDIGIVYNTKSRLMRFKNKYTENSNYGK